jgi:hypothetical protein
MSCQKASYFVLDVAINQDFFVLFLFQSCHRFLGCKYQ